MSTEIRTMTNALRAATVKGKPGVTLKAITPGVVDRYGTVWMPDVFDKSLATRLPTLLWAHDSSEPLGPATGWRRGPDGSPEVDFVYSSFDAVPMAKRAHTQVGDGTIRDGSVGFDRHEWRVATNEDKRRWPGCTEVMIEAGLDEISLVHAGAVPGAGVVSHRSVQRDMSRALAQGRITPTQYREWQQLDREVDEALKLVRRIPGRMLNELSDEVRIRESGGRRRVRASGPRLTSEQLDAEERAADATRNGRNPIDLFLGRR